MSGKCEASFLYEYSISSIKKNVIFQQSINQSIDIFAYINKKYVIKGLKKKNMNELI